MGKRRARGSSARGRSHSHVKRGEPRRSKRHRPKSGVTWLGYGAESNPKQTPGHYDQTDPERPVETIWEPYRAGLV